MACSVSPGTQAGNPKHRGTPAGSTTLGHRRCCVWCSPAPEKRVPEHEVKDKAGAKDEGPGMGARPVTPSSNQPALTERGAGISPVLGDLPC